jgi:hypothetical protein
MTARGAASMALLFLAACDGAVDTGAGGVAYSGPEMVHTPPGVPLEGTAVTLTVEATDPDGVALVQFFHRTEGAPSWVPGAMASKGKTWSIELPGESVEPPGLEYYFQGIDLGDPSALSTLPDAGPSEPFLLPVQVIGNAFPFYEDFEPPDPEVAAITTIGWHNASQGFRGYGWDLSSGKANGGDFAVFHGRGAEVSSPPHDWLISPAIDLTAAPSAQVVWYEYGISADEATHGLYISTGSPDPDDEEYVAVEASLPPASETAWGRSRAYDLSAWVGQVVYLSWSYEGADTDDWFLDDVAVTELEPQFTPSWTTEPSLLAPGTAATLVVSVFNDSPVDATDVVVSAEFTEGGAANDTPPVTIASVAAGATGEARFDIEIDPGTPNNSYVPLTVTVADASVSTSESSRLLVGVASTASVEWLSLFDGALKLVVGVGDPDSPDWSTQVVSGSVLAGTDTYTADITGAVDYLPAGPADGRWWVQASTAGGGAVMEFSLEFDGVTEFSTMAPIAVDEAETGLCYLPEPPDFVVSRLTTSPSELDPGTSGASLSFTLKNDGASTSGPLSARLVSAHADLSVFDPGPIAFGSDPFDGGDSSTVSRAFVFDVAASHVDSSDLDATLLLTDGVESWSVPLGLAVPFPVFVITGVEIDDSGGDGILDPDETASLEFRVTNVGDESSVSLVRAVLSVEATSTATATAGTNSESLGSVSARTTKSVDDLELAVVGGAAGDTVDLLLTLTDSTRTYQARQQLVLGEPPWQPMSDLGDPTGDLIATGDFDVFSGWYRVIDGVLQMRLVSSTAFDPARLFVEAWASSPAADYGLYRILAQSGVGSLQGYDFSSGTFYNLDDPTISYPDAATVQWELPIAYMSLNFDELSIGFGAGWCGEPDYYCDHFPDDWGYPYVGYSTSDWFDLSW